jgi:hypothetical protein
MKPARSIVPLIDQTVEKANGQRVVMVGGGARAIAATVPRGCGRTPTRRAGIGAARSGRSASNRKTAAGADRECSRPGLGNRPASAAPRCRRPDGECRRGTATWQEQC